MKHLIAPSLLSANFLDLRKEVGMINKSDADWLHLDIMDGVFVPNISFGFPVLNALKSICEKPMDVTLDDHWSPVYPLATLYDYGCTIASDSGY